MRAMAEVSWQPKDKETRSIPVREYSLEKLLVHTAKHPGPKWMSPTTGATPNGHMLRKLMNNALRAGLNCSFCKSRSGLVCKEHPVCKCRMLHKFTRSFASPHYAAGVSAWTLMDWLGHSGFETTLGSLAVADEHNTATRAAVNKKLLALASSEWSVSSPGIFLGARTPSADCRPQNILPTNIDQVCL